MAVNAERREPHDRLFFANNQRKNILVLKSHPGKDFTGYSMIIIIRRMRIEDTSSQISFSPLSLLGGRLASLARSTFILTLAGRGGGGCRPPPIGFFRDSSEHAGDRELKLGIPDL